MRRFTPFTWFTQRRAGRLAAVLLAVAGVAGGAGAVSAQPASVPLSGRQLYEAACASCHGGDGRGADRAQVGFDDPLPDFTDCSFASREAEQDWSAIVRDGGRVRGFSRRMPAFGDALTGEQIARVVTYLRTLCRDGSWPRGELNLPRPIATEKAFPEDEVIFTAGTVTARGQGSLTHELIYERRIGARSQWELVVPFGTRERPASAGGGWTSGQLGDIALAFKRALYHDSDGDEGGTIVSAQGEVVFPSGDAGAGFGSGTYLFEPALLAGRTLPGNSFVQAQGGVELSGNTDKASDEAFWRVALGTTLARRFGRSWSPMVELTGAREMESGARSEWDVIPQMQVSLSKRQHILASIGARFPLGPREGRARELVAYLLWDWFDGGLLDGWRE
ncbi:MAG: cytochrome c [Gemmatimonadaceae bacterium]